jgi:6-phosphogluconolactonase (cycloisomerase 2 family)
MGLECSMYSLVNIFSTGAGPAHFLVDLEHNLLLTSIYGAGTLSVSSFVNVFSTGTGPAHLLIDLEHNLLVTSNYGAGTISVFNMTRQLYTQINYHLPYSKQIETSSEIRSKTITFFYHSRYLFHEH